MADVRAVEEGFAVAPQVQPDELEALAARFTTVINNRPDGEEPGQPLSAALELAAGAAGLNYHHIPVVGRPTREQVRAMGDAVGGSTGPVLAFCRTGTRSVVSWAVGQALAGRPVEELTAAGKRAGYDLGPPLAAILPDLRA